MIVTNMQSSTGNPVNNQFVIIDEKGAVTFQSYKSVIAVWYPKPEVMHIDPRFIDYSATTWRYFRKFVHDCIDKTAFTVKDRDFKTIKENTKRGEYCNVGNALIVPKILS